MIPDPGHLSTSRPSGRIGRIRLGSGWVLLVAAFDPELHRTLVPWGCRWRGVLDGRRLRDVSLHEDERPGRVAGCCEERRCKWQGSR